MKCCTLGVNWSSACRLWMRVRLCDFCFFFSLPLFCNGTGHICSDTINFALGPLRKSGYTSVLCHRALRRRRQQIFAITVELKRKKNYNHKVKGKETAKFVKLSRKCRRLRRAKFHFKLKHNKDYHPFKFSMQWNIITTLIGDWWQNHFFSLLNRIYNLKNIFLIVSHTPTLPTVSYEKCLSRPRFQWYFLT